MKTFVMQWLASMRIGQRLILGFGTVFFAVIVVFIFGAWQLSQVNVAVKQALSTDLERVTFAQEWERGIAVNLVRTQALLFENDAERAKLLKKDIDDTSAQVSDIQKRMEILIEQPEGKRLMAEIGRLRGEYRSKREEAFARKKTGDDVLQVLEQTLMPMAKTYTQSIHQFVLYEKQELNKTQENVERLSRLVFMLFIGAAGITLLMSWLGAWSIRHSIVPPLNRARDLAQSIAKGDLLTQIDLSGHDEVAQTMQALSEMQESLRKMVVHVRDISEEVESASTEIATGSQHLSARTEQQAANVEQASASLQEMTSKVRNTAETAQEANTLVEHTSEAANKGGQVFGQVVSTMQQISHSSRKIADIIGVIDGIAFQTNILALNAAVEAARAGEDGRGFAVVAAEVRSLAQRSASAAKEIKTLIDESVSRVDAGDRYVSEANAAMEDIVRSIDSLHGLITQISSTSSEQSQGLGQVNDAVRQLDEMTQQNAALVEQSTAAGTVLRTQAERLGETVALFHVDSHLRPHHASVSVVPPPTLTTPSVPPAPAKTPIKSATKSAPKVAGAPIKSNVNTPKPVEQKPENSPKPMSSPAAKVSGKVANTTINDDDWDEF
jgi:methyl-accepting chemotaxis protein